MYSTDKHGIKLQGNLVESRESIGHGVLPIQIDKVQDRMFQQLQTHVQYKQIWKKIVEKFS